MTNILSFQSPKTGANSLNATTGKPNYIYRYTDPMLTSLSATVRF